MRRILIAALAIVLVSTAVIGGGIGLAVAQGEDTPVQSFLGRVADKLGIGEDELRSAMTEAEQDIIDERVAEGKLTAEQGERLKERIEEKGLLGPRGGLADGPRGRFCDRVFDCIRGGVRGWNGQLTTEAAATVLDMEPEALLSELQEGKTLAEVAEEQGMAVDELTAAMLAEVQQEMDALVADGELTQEQADAIYERVEENIDDIVNALPQPHGPCGRGAFFEGGAPGSSFEPTESSIEA
jgi:polyhydroxyalkanoate synthesis regulator phasin